jgi:hypothetical protein
MKKFFIAFTALLNSSMMGALVMLCFVGAVGVFVPEAFGGAGWLTTILPPEWRLPLACVLLGWMGGRISRMLLMRWRFKRLDKQLGAGIRVALDQGNYGKVVLPPLKKREWEGYKRRRHDA